MRCATDAKPVCQLTNLYGALKTYGAIRAQSPATECALVMGHCSPGQKATRRRRQCVSCPGRAAIEPCGCSNSNPDLISGNNTEGTRTDHSTLKRDPAPWNLEDVEADHGERLVLLQDPVQLRKRDLLPRNGNRLDPGLQQPVRQLLPGNPIPHALGSCFKPVPHPGHEFHDVQHGRRSGIEYAGCPGRVIRCASGTRG